MIRSSALRLVDEFASMFAGLEVFGPNMLLYGFFLAAYYVTLGTGPSRLTLLVAVLAVFSFDVVCDVWLFIRRDQEESAGADDMGTS